MRNAKSRRGNQVLAMAVGAVGVMGLTTMSFGAKTWTGAGINNNWSNTNNWNITTHDRATFEGSPSQRTVNVDSNIEQDGIRFASNADAFTITGNWFYLRSLNLINDSTSPQTFNAGVFWETGYPTQTLSVTQTSGSLTFNGWLAGQLVFEGSSSVGAGGETPTIALNGNNSNYTNTEKISKNITVQVGATGALGKNTSAHTFDLTGKQVLNLGGTTQTIGTLTFNGTTGDALIKNGTISPTATSIAGLGSGKSVTFDTNASLNGTGGLSLGASIASDSVVYLKGSNSYSGTTNVAAGTLLVNGTITSGSSTVTVGASGKLGGTGSIGRPVNVSGTLAAGESIESLDTGNLTLDETSTLDNELGRSGTTPVSDLVNVTGSVTISSGANLKLTKYTGLNDPVANDLYFLISNDGGDAVGGTNGVFTKLNGVATTLNQNSQFTWNSVDWKISYEANYSSNSFTGGNDVAIQVVPEPTSAAGLLASGALMAIRRRRRS